MTGHAAPVMMVMVALMVTAQGLAPHRAHLPRTRRADSGGGSRIPSQARSDVDIEEEMAQVEDMEFDRPAGGDGSKRDKVKVGGVLVQWFRV